MKFFKPVTEDPEVGSIILNIIQSIAGTSDISVPDNTDIGDEIKGYGIMEFIDDIYDFLNQYQGHTQEFKDFSFKPNSTYNIPNEDEGNHLRYNIEERTYATTQQGYMQHNGRKNFKWALRDIVEDKTKPGYKVLVFEKPFDNTLILTSWSKNYRDANKFAFKIEELLDTYRGIFKMKGLLDLRYIRRKDDVFREVSNYAWYGCPIEFYVKTNQIKLVYEKVLEQISIDLTLKKIKI